MIVINKLAKPGDIKRVEITPSLVCIIYQDRTRVVYKLAQDSQQNTISGSTKEDEWIHS
jgi:hypothetical protein